MPTHLSQINPASLPNSLAAGYSQAIFSEAGRAIYLAGQVGWDKDGKMDGDGSFATQARKALENVSIALKEAGASGADIVHLKCFVVGLTEHRIAELSRAIRDASIFDFNAPPTGTLVGIERLARAELLVEIEGVAVLPN